MRAHTFAAVPPRSLAGLLAGCLGLGTALADSGTIFGTIELDNEQTVTGVMRWGEQESHWIHHFNGDKAEPFDLDLLSSDDRETVEANLPGPRFEVGGHVIELVRWLGTSDLQRQSFAVEFGLIREIEPQGGERVKLTLVDGSTIEARGGSDDIGAEIDVMTSTGNVRDVSWDDVERIRFHAPDSAAPAFPQYLYGKVRTRDTTYVGFVDWDQDERYPDEELDGDVDGEERSITFAAIRKIKNLGESSLVTLTDGTELTMSDTNDVNSENRGIIVHMADIGRVLVPWSAFEEVEFTPQPDNLPRYADFASGGPIQARVKGQNQEFSGNLIFDLDHRHQGEMLHGKDEAGVQFQIPWRHITRLVRQEDNRCEVLLRNGQTLALGRDPDVTGANSGVAVQQSGGKARYLAWTDVKEIETRSP
ncbi:MAG: hypothetical protein AAGA23_01755 [Pseudomonadota bacterium]